MTGVPRLVAVAGAKGSPGISTVATGLALEVAARGVETLLVDADTEDGVLSDRLECEQEPDPRPLVRASKVGALGTETVRRAALPLGPRLTLLDVSGPGGSGIHGTALVDAVAGEEWGAVVVDLGHAFGDLQVEFGQRADRVLWVVAADRLGLIRADRLLEGNPLRPQSAGVIVNRVRGRDGLSAARALAQRHDLPVLARFRSHAAAADRWGRNRGVHRAWAFAGAYRELARAVHPGLLALAQRGVWP